MAVFGRKNGIGILVEASNMVAPRSKRERERERELRTCTIAHRVHVHVFGSTDPGQVSILLGSFALAPRSVSCRTNESKGELEERRGLFCSVEQEKGINSSFFFFFKNKLVNEKYSKTECSSYF
jgi:hypothetical protein